MSDDIGMEALKGDFGSRAAGVVDAGCDVALHCSGDLEEMVAIAKAVPGISRSGEARLRNAMASIVGPEDKPDFADALATRDALLSLV